MRRKEWKRENLLVRGSKRQESLLPTQTKNGDQVHEIVV